jgi:hypothetical protein
MNFTPEMKIEEMTEEQRKQYQEEQYAIWELEQALGSITIFIFRTGTNNDNNKKKKNEERQAYLPSGLVLYL